MTKVLYVMGFGRSGSTILDNLLNEVDGFVSTGELHNLFRRGLLRGQACGCGKPVPDCDFWREVLSREVDGVSLKEHDPAEILSWQEQTMRPRHTRRLLRYSGRSERPPALDRYARVLRHLYMAVAEVAGAGVVVDSSKWPSPAALLPTLDGIDPHLIHLVRDPRAVAFSRQRVKAGLDHEMRRRSAPYISFRWAQRDSQARRVLDRYPPERRMTLRYEDFAASPRSSVERLIAFVGESGNPSFLDEQRAHLTGNHTAAGNPSRHRTGEVAIREDREWISAQTLFDRLAATAATALFLGRYRYPLRLQERAGAGAVTGGSAE